MSETALIPFGDFYNDIDENEFLNELYDDILFNYSMKLFNVSKYTPREIDTTAALRFADILSKSTHPEKSDSHKIWAQEIVALLHYMDKDSPAIDHVLGSVLSNTGNILGKIKQAANYQSPTLLENIYDEFNKSLLRVPAERDNPEYFFRTQKQVYDSFSNDYFSYSAPTSMGKSYIMRMFIKEQIQNSKALNFAILVPTKALINEVYSEVSEDLKNLLKDKNYKLVTSAGSLFLKGKHNFIFVLTPERLLYLLINYPNIDLDYLFVDEAHNISTGRARSTFYYQVVGMLSRKPKQPQKFFASPNIPNPEIYLKLIPNSNAEKKLAVKFAPVSQIKYYIDCPNKKIYMFNKHQGKDGKLTEIIPKINAAASFCNVLSHIGKGKQNLVYCRSKAKALELALEFSQNKPDVKNTPEVKKADILKKLAGDITSDIHGDCYLAGLVKKGVAYHVGYLPASIRLRIEELYKQGIISTLFCTSTLVEGVNLPADNLFITSYYNGRSIMDEVDFNNLVGRVGRIRYNLFGNVFLARLEDNRDNSEKRFKEFLKVQVPKQKLSVSDDLTTTQRQAIVSCLMTGSLELSKQKTLDKSYTPEEYEIMRKFASILSKDILYDRKSAVWLAFAAELDETKETTIRDAFKSKKDKMDDDITVSVDQIESLEQAIRGGLTYPALDDGGYINHTDLMTFLDRLCVIFKWEKYEFGTLGKLCKYTSQRKQLGRYAVLLAKWLQGKGVQYIINETLKYKRDNPVGAQRLPNNQMVDFDFRSMEHKNLVIGEVLDDIENIILFRLSNYFLKFSTVYEKVHGKTPYPNDWYEFVEYGTTNESSIFLQRIGLQRETANYVKDKNLYVKVGDADYRLKNAVFSCDKESVIEDVTYLYYNAPELFTD